MKKDNDSKFYFNLILKTENHTIKKIIIMETICIISIIVAIICFFITLVVGLTTDLLREPKTNPPCSDPSPLKTPFSFSRVQFWLWTLVICPAFVINWGFHYFDKPYFDKEFFVPYLNETSLILLGISVSVTFGSGVIGGAQAASRTRLNGQYSLKSDRKSQGFWTDILTDSEGQFSIGRLQNFLFTLVYLVIYIAMFFQKSEVYPDFERTAYILMGISSGGYLMAKGDRK